jgi:hypothetical protein
MLCISGQGKILNNQMSIMKKKLRNLSNKLDSSIGEEKIIWILVRWKLMLYMKLLEMKVKDLSTSLTEYT